MNNLEINNLDGWAIPREAFDWIINNLPQSSTILELGSGTGTIELVKHYNVYSIEHQKQWVGKAPESNYIYAPLKKYEGIYNWYDTSYLNNLPKDYDLLLIDGPIGRDRLNFVNFTHLFKTNIPYVIDDTNRPGDKEMAINLSKMLDKEIIEIKGWEKEMMILI